MGDKQPYRKMTLLHRTALTFESFLHREFNERFYREEFLNGICARRLEVVARVGKAAGQTMILATLLAFFDLISGSVSYSGLTLQITQDLAPVIAFLTAGALLNTTFAMIDEQIIYRIFSALGSNINIQSIQLMLVDKMAHNLWAEALVPRRFGEKSGKGHSVAFIGLSLLVMGVSAFLLLYPAFMVTWTFCNVINSDGRIVAIFIAAAAFALVIWALLLGLIFIVKFKFYPADWIESTDQPTDDFIRRMQAEIARGGQDLDRPESPK
ncbi:hypothetical protein IG197_27410 [Aminobacter sp. SR38]|jgi:hypothetical protein|uniref:hypothetical protein n=1 Tax=Aminobacter sp. SR38 TaxID=2774562 RepID=UPI0017861210|nr:hypothetical protein [Aminobacter sp. SR38]QOF71430.1 hypothetical protein IG197_27410 [Aminobacter sp. SR38]